MVQRVTSLVTLVRPSEPARGPGCRVLPDVLGLTVLVQTARAKFPADPRLLEAAPLGLRQVRVVVVDPDRPVAQPAGDALGARGVGGPDRAGQPVGRVVAELDRLVLGREPLDVRTGPKTSSRTIAHVAADVGEDRRAVEEAGLELGLVGSAPAGDEPGALVDGAAAT